MSLPLQGGGEWVGELRGVALCPPRGFPPQAEHWATARSQGTAGSLLPGIPRHAQDPSPSGAPGDLQAHEAHGLVPLVPIFLLGLIGQLLGGCLLEASGTFSLHCLQQLQHVVSHMARGIGQRNASQKRATGRPKCCATVLASSWRPPAHCM